MQQIAPPFEDFDDGVVGLENVLAGEDLGCTGTGSCTLFCGSAANCSLACGDAASCTMVHENATTDFEFSCGLENSEECSASVRTCNAPCPD
jgi:hypothetical protein